MTKRVALLLATIAMVGGTAWAQISVDPGVPGGPDGVFHNFNAVPTLSTEARYSAGRFTTDVDTFLDPRFHNPEIGTFFFLGGFPAAGNVENTNVLTPDHYAPNNRFALSFGFGHNFNAFYLGVYYGGSFVNARGARDRWENDQGPGGVEDARAREAVWQNNIAVLVGLLNMGFRLDFIQDGNVSNRNSVDGELGPGGEISGMPPSGTPGRTVEHAPSMALTWGMRMGRLAPFAQIGFQFRDQEIWRGYYERRGWYEQGGSMHYGTLGYDEVEYRLRTGGAFGMSAGARFELNDTARVGGSLRFGSRFADSDQFTWGSDSDSVTAAGGQWGLGLNAYYMQNIDAGLVAVGFRPRMDMAFARQTRSSSIVEDHAALSPYNLFTLGLGVDLGIRIRPTQRFAFFTGAGLNFFEWNIVGHSDNDIYSRRSSAWTFEGISWDQSRTTATGHLGFGMTFTPVENVVIGFGLNTILDQFFRIDLYQMQVDTGGDDSWWRADRNNFVAQFGYIFSDITLDLTVSVRLGGNGNRNGNGAAAPAPAPAPAPAADEGDGSGDE